jgi:histone acetyltransferase (RNA polymerase elongator complex component)
VREYASSNGTEYFISIEDQMGYLYGFARLCCPAEGGIADRPGLGQGTAMIRELHVYGQLATLTVEDKLENKIEDKVV